MIEVLLSLLIPVLIVGAIIVFFVRRGLQFRELCECGVETEGLVVEKRTVNSGSSARQHKLVYSYMDSHGSTHHHTSVVTYEVSQSLGEGDKIEIVYSSKHSQVSAPKFLVNQSRKALGK